MTVDPVAAKSTPHATPHATSQAASQAASQATAQATAQATETDSKKIGKVTTVLPRQDLPTQDLPTQDLPKKSPSEKILSEKSPLAEDISFSKRSRRRHRRRVFKPKRRGRPRHMLPGGSR